LKIDCCFISSNRKDRKTVIAKAAGLSKTDTILGMNEGHFLGVNCIAPFESLLETHSNTAFLGIDGHVTRRGGEYKVNIRSEGAKLEALNEKSIEFNSARTGNAVPSINGSAINIPANSKALRS